MLTLKSSIKPESDITSSSVDKFIGCPESDLTNDFLKQIGISALGVRSAILDVYL